MKTRVMAVLLVFSLLLYIFTVYSQLLNYQSLTGFPAENNSSSLNLTVPLSNNTVPNSINESVPIGDDRPSFLKVVLKVDNTGGGTFQSNNFWVKIQGPDISPNLFSGSVQGTVSRALPGTYVIKLEVNGPYTMEFSGDCNGTDPEEGKIIIKPGVRVSCIVTATYVNF